MAKHKAPTEVTLVGPDEKSPFAELVEKHWPKAAILAILGTAAILFLQYQRQQENQRIEESWGRLMSAVEPSQLTRRLRGDPQELGRIAQDLGDTSAGPWARYLQAQSFSEEGQPGKAAEALAALAEEHPEHPLVTQRYRFGDSVTPVSMVEHLRKTYNASESWREEHADLFRNPDPAQGAPRVRIRTSEGDIVVALYEELAPKLTENFLKLSDEGFYDDTKVHRVRPGLLVEAGDPASRDGDPSTWGTEGADYTIDAEPNALSHFPGYLGMTVKEGTENPNGSLFHFTVAPVHGLNFRYMVFGKVLEGQDVVEAISNVETETPSLRPVEPITILGTEVLPGV